MALKWLDNLIYSLHPTPSSLKICLNKNMKVVKHFIINIVISSVVLYVIANFIPELWLTIKSQYKDIFVIFWVLWILFWFIMSLLRRIIQMLALPAKYVTLWLSSLVINLFMFYFFEQFINFLDVWIQVQLGTVVQTFILSLIITSLYFVIRKFI